MTAMDIYEAAFDTTRIEYFDYSSAGVQAYAEGAMDLFISDEVAEKIAQCAVSFRDNGHGENDFFYLVEKPLRDIELHFPEQLHDE